jgi:hypothetical protein
MSSADFTRPPLSFFAPPGEVSLAPSAMALAREFRELARTADMSDDLIISFDWADERRVRNKADGKWRDLGPGLDLAAYARKEIPAAAIQTLEGMPVAFRIPAHVLRASVKKQIERDDAVAGKLRLV